MIERKCLKCGTWNNNEDYCKNCENPLSPLALDKEREVRLKKEKENEEPSKFDLFLKKTKNHKYMLVRWFYYFIYSMGIIAGGIGAFLAWLAAMANA